MTVDNLGHEIEPSAISNSVQLNSTNVYWIPTVSEATVEIGRTHKFTLLRMETYILMKYNWPYFIFKN